MSDTNASSASEAPDPFSRILVVGAHPDDAEFHAGGVMVSQAARGSQIGILSLTDGSAGHQHMDRPALARRRRAEAESAASMLGATVTIWDVPDGELVPSLANRLRLIKAVRKFQPDLLITHRTNDYHPDHRATALLVQDACYMLRVPNVVPEVAVLQSDPVVLSCADFFTRPVPIRADVVVPVDAVFEQILDLLSAHESQVFEWLPHITDQPLTGDRRDWLRRFFGARPAALARRHAPQARYAEVFEISEYGRRMSAEEIQLRLGTTLMA